MKFLIGILLLVLSGGNAAGQAVAAFSYQQMPQYNEVLRTVFTDLSSYGSYFTGRNAYVRIHYGDGTSDGGYNISYIAPHNYPDTGIYNVSIAVKILDAGFNVLSQDSLTDTVHIRYLPCVFRAARTLINDSTAAFTVHNLSNAVWHSISWDFGDGTLDTGINPVHTYSTNGYYPVRVVSLQLSTTGACSYVDTIGVPVSMPSKVNCDSLKPGIHISATGNDIFVKGTIGRQYPRTRFNWQYNYGDDSLITTVDTHFYFSPGRYRVRGYVSVYDSTTRTVVCRDTVSDSVFVDRLNTQIIGEVHFDSLFAAGFTGPVKLWLIGVDTLNGALQSRDSLVVSGAGPLSFRFRFVPPGSYLIKAASAFPDSLAAGILPTYSFSTPQWSTAQRFNFDGSQLMIFMATLIAQRGSAGTGPGFIGGLVSLGANKGAGAGAAGVSLILRNANGGLIAIVETDAQGRYAFNNVPDGTYTVMPELLNYDAMQSAPVTVSASSATVSGLNFTKDDLKMNIRASTLGMNNSTMPELSISPVPAQDFVRITAGKETRAAAPLEFRDLSGKVMLRSYIQPGSVLKLDIRSLPAGMYFVHPGTGAPVKLVVQ